MFCKTFTLPYPPFLGGDLIKYFQKASFQTPFVKIRNEPFTSEIYTKKYKFFGFAPFNLNKKTVPARVLKMIKRHIKKRFAKVTWI